MKFNDNPLMILVGIILLGLGIGSFFGYQFFPNDQYTLIAVFVLAAILIILLLSGHLKEYLGVVLMIIWLLLMGVMAWFQLQFVYSSLILSALPVGAGFFLLLGY